MGPIFLTFGPGAGAGTPWARGLGAPEPKMWDTRGECNYLLSGKLPTVRHAPNNRILCTQPSHIHAPKSRTHAPKRHRLCTQRYPYTLHPTSAYFAPNRAIDMHPKGIAFAPKRHRFAPKSSPIHAPKMCICLILLQVCRMTQDLSNSLPMVFRSQGTP